ncbi:MAG: helix-turn-helix domain-containing protein [bacterium]
MDEKKRKALEAQGWRVGNTEEFLGLSVQETIYIDLKLALGENLKKRRQQKNLTQTELAKLLKSNPSRVAKMEAGDPSVSLDLLIKSLLVLGSTRQDLAGIIAQESGFSVF